MAGAVENPLESTLLLNISDMIDLAIGTPEVGVVDFNMLQSVLHVLAQQMRVLGKTVELRGSAAQLPTTRDNAQTVAITEYIVETDEQIKAPDKSKLMKVPEGAPPGGVDQDTLLVVERIKKVDTPIGKGGPQKTTKDGATGVGVAHAGVTSQMSGAAGAGGQEKVSLVSISKFNLLETTVNDLKSRVYGSIPKNETILEEVRSQTNLKSITDMWTSLNVSSRLEAAETGLSKLSSLIQDLIGENAAAAGGKKTPEEKAALAAALASGGPDDLTGVKKVLQVLRTDLDELASIFYAFLEEQGIEIPHPAPVSVLYATGTGGPVPSHGVDGESQSTTSTRTTKSGRHGDASSGAGGGGRGGAGGGVDGVTDGDDPKTCVPCGTPAPAKPALRAAEKPRLSFGSAGVNTRLDEIQKKIAECCDERTKAEDIVHEQLTSFQDQLQDLTSQVATLTTDLTAGKLSADFINDVQGLLQLFQTVQEMQEQLKDLHDTASKLCAEKEDRRQHMNALLEQIELLKTIKLDREDMVEAMAEKADINLLARKVSHDQFETACEDLSRGVERALGKLNIQEALWQQALDDIQREIEMKLDKYELGPVKEFFNNKLRQLQDNLKQMADLRREVEAAGTKKRLLRDVNCISCDAKTVMAMDAAPSLPVSKPMPPSLSMKPYLSYELDAIRKQQASGGQQRNMHDWENIEKQMQQPKPLPKVRTDSEKHLCNRYCGGSHTVTTASQRVVRLGHFLRQWGPDVLPLSSSLAAGDDGKMYKISTNDTATVGPGGAVDGGAAAPKSQMKKGETCTRPSQVTPKPECRCLEAAENMKG